MNKIQALRIDAEGRRPIEDIVTEEVPLTIHCNGREWLTLLCSPEGLKELCMGFLYSSGVIAAPGDVKNITIDRQNWAAHIDLSSADEVSQLLFKRLYTSGCGRGTHFYNALDRMHEQKNTSTMMLSSQKIIDLIRMFQDRSIAFKETGGVHSAAMSDGKILCIFKEDIGRHNALDKVIGAALMQGLAMSSQVVITSGRISSEIMFKIQKTRCPMVISPSAPTDQAVALAKRWQVILIGFARGRRMNVYTASERVT